MPVKLPYDKLEFILNNKGKMKQKDIAAAINVTPACVCKILKPKAKVIIMPQYFNIDHEYKKHYK